MSQRDVIQMMDDFRAKLDTHITVNRERVIGELARLGLSNMQDFYKLDENGHASIDLSRVSRDQAAAIQEITVEDTEGGGKRTKLKLSNKREALELLGRHLKLFEDGGQVNVGVKVILVDIPRPDRTPELPDET